jgi:Beta/Gamma crystallin
VLDQRRPGGYPFVTNVGISNDDMSSLEPVNQSATVRNPALIQEGVILFEHANYHGAHKHVLRDEANLNASDDHFFNDKVSSFIVFSGQWEFFRDYDFQNPYGVVLSKDIYSFVENVGIKNDDMSSLRPR